MKKDYFKIGDCIVRIKNEHLGMLIGDIDIVEDITDMGLILKNYKISPGFSGSHAFHNFVTIQLQFDFNKGE